MCKNVVVVGAGGHAKVIGDIIIKSGDKLLGFLDDNKTGIVFLDYSVIGTIKDIAIMPVHTEFIIGIGNNTLRRKIDEKYNVLWYTAIHPSAQISLDVVLGKGTAVMASAVINSSVNIGNHCIINTGAVVEHDNIIKNYVHVSPNATLCGTVTIGSSSHVGASATVINNINVGENTIIGAGAVVVKDLPANCTAVGAPARVIKVR